MVGYIFCTIPDKLKNDFPFKSNQCVLLYVKQMGIRIMKTTMAIIRTVMRNSLSLLSPIDRQAPGGVLGALQGPGAIAAVAGGLALGPLNEPLTQLIDQVLSKSIKP